ncbi:MAG: serine hydrolase [Dermatophilaceae bacterium]|nr:serine hydrolase [Dermatophilaceae bacterium]MBP9919029.1 serine hydrolase [Dermatophilaceae bacterium]
MWSTSRRLGALLTLAPVLVVAACTDATNGGPATPHSTATTRSSAPNPADLAVLAPRAGYGIYDATNGRCSSLVEDGLAEPVPVASVFKLWVLDAVARSIDASELAWDTPVTIRDTLRSDPSGEAFGYPEGTLVPLAKLAELMISISDNTATDHLIDLVSREAITDVIRELAPDGAARTLPLLTTADMARLKFVHPNLGAEYIKLDDKARVQFLANLPERAPFPWPDDPAAMDQLDLTTPAFVDEIEWFATGTDICTTMAHLAALARRPGLEALDAILSTNPGLPPTQTRAWTTTWFKGGSEPGVIALAYRLATADIDRVVVIALSDANRDLVQHAQGQQLIEAILDAAHD